MPARYRVSWREWGGILATCTMCGTVLGALAFWARTPAFPVPYLPLAVLGSFAVALAFGLIASVFGAVAIVLVARRGAPSESRLRLAATGAIAGGFAGLLHPLVIVLAIVRTLSPESSPWSAAPLAVLVAASGALAGALIIPRYVPAVRARS
jgi:uncharacterized membrane protein